MNKHISPSDTMFEGSIERYLDVGYSALNAIRSLVRDRSVSSILDFPCGFGRVARHLRAAWPDASLFVADLDEHGMQFCSSTFEAEPLTSNSDFDLVNFGIKFDLIWVGSLITHLRAADTKKFFGFLSRHLAGTGVAVVTSHGELVGDRLKSATGWMYGIPDAEQNAVYDDASRTGYGYCRYPLWNIEYGISLSTPEWIRQASSEYGLSLIDYLPAAWDNHQDVFGLTLASMDGKALISRVKTQSLR